MTERSHFLGRTVASSTMERKVEDEGEAAHHFTTGQSVQKRRSTLLSHERTDGSAVIGVGPMSLGCAGALTDASVVICLVVTSVSTRLMASSNMNAVEVFFVKWTLAKPVRSHGACAIVDGAPVFKSIYL